MFKDGCGKKRNLKQKLFLYMEYNKNDIVFRGTKQFFALKLNPNNI